MAQVLGGLSRDTSRTPLVMILIAFLAASAAAVSLWSYEQSLERAIGGGPKVAVLCARTALAAGTQLGKSHLQVQQVPQAYRFPRFVTTQDYTDILGATVITAVAAGDVLLWTDLKTRRGARDSFASRLPPGKSAIDVKFANASALRRIAKVGDRVDILLTEGGKRSHTRLLLENLAVIFVPANPKDSNFLLAVTKYEYAVITQATEVGSLTGALRATGDIGKTKASPKIHYYNLPGAPPPPKKKVRKKSTPRPRRMN